MSNRLEEIDAFLNSAGWGVGERVAIPGDASTRRYFRLNRNGRPAILMDQPQKAESPAAPLGASVETRRGLGYNALARLAGADCARFVAVARHLRGLGLSAPEIYAADPALGLVLIEDLGTALYADVVANGGDAVELYARAVEVLARLHAHPAPGELASGVPLHRYDEAALAAEVDLMTEWFFPVALGRAATQAEVAQHRALWRATLAPVLGAPSVFVHRDYHAQNLLWLPQRAGAAAVGLIDFQDAVAGSPAYDLVSLIEDARRDVSPELARAITAHYLAAMAAQGTPRDSERFAVEAAIAAAQRNAKIVGIFARLYKRDGKAAYLEYLPRVWSYLDRDLDHPALGELKRWYDSLIPQSARGRPQAGV
jgi:N-acetylmuramate 1-kinase